MKYVLAIFNDKGSETYYFVSETTFVQTILPELLLDPVTDQFLCCLAEMSGWTTLHVRPNVTLTACFVSEDTVSSRLFSFLQEEAEEGKAVSREDIQADADSREILERFFKRQVKSNGII